eukprot:CAMPEP_0170564842 /NCGR_PEP_ID=MMETSP0211-20121228/75248_1 /TAXON_ID=311385 /ORGANISM="Pseudokeronopsis sp., Strain OXSARD2" /LENGTH=55 /DNA_ID=CAMNT_0010884833 /DNA_START=186 /DNA_END=353 /DNA_ORIENTATION=-
MKNKDGYILVYDASESASQKYLEDFILDIDKDKAFEPYPNKKIPILFVGNKADLG